MFQFRFVVWVGGACRGCGRPAFPRPVLPTASPIPDSNLGAPSSAVPPSALDLLAADDAEGLAALMASSGLQATQDGTGPEETMLHTACRMNAVQCVRMLLRGGSVVNSASARGLTVSGGCWAKQGGGMCARVAHPVALGWFPVFLGWDAKPGLPAP